MAAVMRGTSDSSSTPGNIPDGVVATPVETRGWFVGRNDAAAARRLVCFPHAGAGATAYLHWPRFMPPEMGLQIVRLPGRETRIREPPYRHIRDVVRDLAAATAVLADRPMVFFGHSLGAIVAFELVRELRRIGLPLPCHLYVSGRPAPHLGARKGTKPLTDEALVRLLRDLGGTPQVFFEHPTLVAAFLPPLRADLEMNERYEFVDEAPIEVSITAFSARGDQWVPAEAVAEWSNHTAREFALASVEGDHFSVVQEPQALLERVLADAETWPAAP